MIMLSKEEIKRYSQQLLLSEIGKSGQEKLKQAKVLVVGAGGLGCPVLQYLAATGIGTIGIVDFDVVEESNLHRQVLYSIKDLGKSKVEVAAGILADMNPYIQTIPYNEKLESHNAIKIISGYDLLVDCSDNFETRYLVNDACVLLNKSFVYGGIHRFEGQLAVFNFKFSNGSYGPTYRCVFPEPHPSETLLNCSLNGVIGTLSGIIGTLQANEVIKMIAGIGEVQAGRMLLFNALQLTFSIINIDRNESFWNNIPKSERELMNKIYSAPVESNME